MKAEYGMVEFREATRWREWLEKHHDNTDGVWLRFYKKASNVATVTYAEALDAALCFGWIDGQVKKHDELSYIQKFTPRRARSMWSKRNIEYVERLRVAGLMTPAGEAQVAAAQADGRWEAAYDKPSDMQASAEFLAALENEPIAKAFYETLNKTNRYAIAWRLQTARTDATRLRRQKQIITMLIDGKTFH